MSIFDNVQLITECVDHIQNNIKIECEFLNDENQFDKDIKNNKFKTIVYKFVDYYIHRVGFYLRSVYYHIDKDIKSDIFRAMKDVYIMYRHVMSNKIELRYIFNYNQEYYIESYNTIELKQIIEYNEDKDFYKEISRDEKSITKLLDYLKYLDEEENSNKQEYLYK